MRLSPRLPLILALLLAACGGGGGDSAIPGGTTVAPTPPTPVSLRGTLVGSASVVPVSVGGSTVNTLSTQQLASLLNSAQSAVSGSPTCSITTYTVQYHTIGSAGEDTTASTAIMVPSGNGAGCTGSRPVLLYAHGTSVLKSTDMADLSATEPLLIAAIFATQGYIVVAPNYAGYAGSTLSYTGYLDAEQQSSDMIDGLRAARLSFGAIGALDSGKLYVTGYSQGGAVALATQRAMQLRYASEFTVAAAGGLSGPYALTQFGDTIFGGAPTTGSAAFLPLVINAGQRAGAALYTSTSDIYEDPYATGIDTLFPGTLGIGDLVAAGKLPNDVLFAQDSLPQTAGYASFFGADHLIKTAYRNTYLADMQANPCGTNNTSPLACTPGQALRRWLVKNDLRTYLPTVPLLLCGGDADPIVPFFNADLTTAYFRGQGMSPNLLTELDIDSSDSINDPYGNDKAAFAAAKEAVKLAEGSAGVQASYHAGLVAPFCLRAAREFFHAH